MRGVSRRITPVLAGYTAESHSESNLVASEGGDVAFAVAVAGGARTGQHSMSALLMVGFVRVDFECAVNLLEQNHSHELMGEGHRGEAELPVGPREDVRRKAE